MNERRDISCEELSRRYAAGELSPREAKAFKAHWARCGECKRFLSQWEELLGVLSAPVSSRYAEPSPEFDKPIMAFVRSLIRGRAEARVAEPRSTWSAVLRSKLVWASGISTAVLLVVLGLAIKGFTITLPSGEKQYVSAISWIVDLFGQGIEWLVFSFMRTLKIGGVFVQLTRILDPFLNILRIAAERIDPQVILAEVLLFMLGLVILRAFVATAQKERCENVRICL